MFKYQVIRPTTVLFIEGNSELFPGWKIEDGSSAQVVRHRSRSFMNYSGWIKWENTSDLLTTTICLTDSRIISNEEFSVREEYQS